MRQSSAGRSEAAVAPAARASRRPSVSRRSAAIGIAAAAGLGVAAALGWGLMPAAPQTMQTGSSQSDWQTFRARFITADGRVVDTGNGGVTHSEGQGYGMLFAVSFDDRTTFDSLLQWTQRTLRRPNDTLHAWRYRPDAAVPVDDRNNATDGDLMIAWALLRAGERWAAPEYTTLGRAMAGDLLRHCTRRVAGLTVLLPGAFGFEHAGRVVINPSYYIFPALAALSKAAPDPAWDAVWRDGLLLIGQGRFGAWHLPPDWLEISNGSQAMLSPAQGWPARFSWDAARVPLHLAWAGLSSEPALAASATFWEKAGRGSVRAWADLGSDAVAPDAAPSGMAAIARLACSVCSGQSADPALPHIGNNDDYYSAALVLLSRLALTDRQLQSA